MMDLPDELRNATLRHVEALEAVPWAWEADRWSELVFCILNAVSDVDSAQCRELTNSIRELGLIEPGRLAESQDEAGDTRAALRYLLTRYGFDKAAANRTIDLLGQVAQAVIAAHGGKIQRYLRVKAETMRDELVDAFGPIPSFESQIHRAVAHWLQNCVNMPLSVNDASVEEFCRRHDATLQMLEDAADQIDLNIAVVDDVIRMDAAETSEGSR